MNKKNNTNRVIILGNGLDLDLKLKTSYSDFLKKYRLSTPEWIQDDSLSNNNWLDLELCLRKMIICWSEDYPEDIEKAKEINLYWQYYTRNFSAFFLEKTNAFEELLSTEENRIATEKSCAYKFLKSIVNRNEIYTFNYTDPYYYLEGTMCVESPLNFVHGRYIHDSYKENVGMAKMLQFHNMILGLDSVGMEQYIKGNTFLIPIIKQQHSSFTITDLYEKLDRADMVIFFGHSLGITDSDYFKDFFVTATNENPKCKEINFITGDRNGKSGIINNMRTWGIDFNQIKSKTNFIYTKDIDVCESENFNKLLKKLS